MPNATELKFGFPETCVAQTRLWTVLLRPRQPTMGALVLVCRESVTAFSAISAEAFADLQQVVKRTEACLHHVVGYEKINYLMLMMVDPDVHFHVLPRYSQPRELLGQVFADAGWPGQPALEPAVVPEAVVRAQLLLRLQDAWGAAGG